MKIKMTKHAGVTGIGDVVRQRVVFDPTAEMAGGVSGGGWASYYFSRFRPQHVAGVYAMGSWMGVLT